MTTDNDYALMRQALLMHMEQGGVDDLLNAIEVYTGREILLADPTSPLCIVCRKPEDHPNHRSVAAEDVRHDFAAPGPPLVGASEKLSSRSHHEVLNEVAEPGITNPYDDGGTE